MTISDIFWRRQKRTRDEYPDVYQYDTLPKELRVQIVQMWHEDVCAFASVERYKYFERAVRKLRREFGVFALPPQTENNTGNFSDELTTFYLYEEDIEKALSAIEVTFVEEALLSEYNHTLSYQQCTILDQAVEELNQRFREHGVGYQLERGKIIRIDSEFTHTEIIKQSLRLLNQKNDFLKGAEDEFLKAHEYYRKGENKDAVVWCNKALESTMKAICIKRSWTTKAEFKNMTASPLVTLCVKNGLVPDYWDKKYRDGLTVMLKHGVPPGRNNLGSHGQGEEITEVQNHTVSYILNMTGAAIKYLCEQEETLK